MVLLEDITYEETKRILLGKFKIPIILKELNEWFFDTFSINIINFEFNKLKNRRNTHRLLIIFRNRNEYNKMYVGLFEVNEQYQKIIADKFIELALKFNYTDKSKLEDMLVAFIDFSHEAKSDSIWKSFNKAKRVITKKFPEVWNMTAEFESSVVFYLEDKDISANIQNGLSKKITDEYYSILKKYDEFNYFTSNDVIIKFDSKENLDKNYDGNLFYYFKK